MNKTIYFLIALTTSACCSISTDVSLDNPAARSQFSDSISKSRVSKKYPDHFLACRAKDPEIVAGILRGIEKEKQSNDIDVVLYFHGGLSNQKYMVNKLGKWLMDEMFEQVPVKKKLYPVFMNYDAGPFSWDLLMKERQKLLDHPTYETLIDAVADQLGIDSNKDFIDLEEPASVAAAELIYVFKGDDSVSFKSSDNFSDDDIELFHSLLEAETLPDEFSEQKNDDADFGALATLVDELQADYETKLKADTLIERKSLTKFGESKLRVLRILARFALKTGHGFFATIQEEILDAWGVGNYGKKHWDKVKAHADECFAPGSNGEQLLAGIRQLQQKYADDPLGINTLSHSAGSIPTAELIDHLSDQPNSASALNQVVMVAPAINQAVFSELVMPNTAVFENLTIYSLTEAHELKDQVFSSILYSSSLLYAVSSLAEGTRYMDKMLLIGQHLDPERRPYDSKTYQCLVCEEPQPVWDYIDATQRVSVKLYPGKKDTTHDPEEGPTHEGTKFPWKSTDLARRYLALFGVEGAGALVFDEPDE